jgi:hypothetical protein
VTGNGRRTLPCIGQIALRFEHPDPKGEPVREHLSCIVAAPHGRTLWLASDETAAVERLVLSEDGSAFEGHETIDLRAPFALPGVDVEEADIEGLAIAQGYLWAVGSHSLARRKPKKKETADERLLKLGEVKLEANRFLLGRIPLSGADDDAAALVGKVKATEAARTLRTGRLPIAEKPKHLKAAATRSALTMLLAADEHFGRFLDVPAKENGFDVEGVVVIGSRLFLGLRGPVLRGHATIIEIGVDAARDGSLSLAPPATGGAAYRKHFLDLDGLGVRSLMVRGGDFWILAGPTMDLDGPVRLYAWKGAAHRDGRPSAVVPDADVAYLGDLPHGDGDDHAEGVTVLRLPHSRVDRLLVVYDGPSKARRIGDHGVLADFFALPAS